MLALILFILSVQLILSYNSNVVASSSNFTQIVSTSTFVDKTLMIKTILEGPRRIIITAPPAFGKSTNLGMLMKFCQLNLDDAGNIVSRELTTNHKLFMEYNLNIVKRQIHFYICNFGTYPIIYLDFKRISGGTLDECLSKLRKILYENIEKHEYLIKSDALSRKQQDHYKMLFKDGEGCNNWKYCVLSVAAISESMWLHHSRNSLLIVDNLDAPILAALGDYANPDQAKDIVHYLSLFMMKSLSCNYVDKVILTGSTYLSTVLLKDIKDIVHFPFMGDHSLANLHGFTENEVIALTRRLKLQGVLSDIEEWYGGYSVIGEYNNIHNPAAVVSYLNTSVLNSSWLDITTVPNIKHILSNAQIYQQLQLALEGNSTNTRFTDKIEVGDILRLKLLISDADNITANTLHNRDKELLFQLISDFAFLTVVSVNGFKVSLKVPNKSAKIQIQNQLYTLPQELDDITDPTINAYIKSIDGLGEHENSYTEFGKAVLHLVQKVKLPSAVEQLREEMEYALFIHGNFPVYKIGRSTDNNNFMGLMLVREDHTGIIIEVTCGPNPSYKALKQIFHEDSDLYKEMMDKSSGLDVQRTIFLGISLSSKVHCHISYLYNTSDLKHAKTVFITIDQRF